MPEILNFKTIKDPRGALTVIEDIIPFEIKRIFYIYNVDHSTRGKHRHHKTVQAAVCIAGSCVIENNNGKEKETFIMDSPEKCLLLYPEDFHSMHKFTPEAILMVMASEKFDPQDYIYEPYE